MSVASGTNGRLTLSEVLGKEIDYLTGKCLIGKLSASDIKFLHDASPSNPFNTIPGQYSSQDSAFNPTPPGERSDFFYDFSEVDERDCDDMITPSLRALLPCMTDPAQFRFTYLKCDFIPLHDDQGMDRFDLHHSLVIVLDAPLGCNLVTGEDCQTPCEPGDVYLIDDQVKHGAFPLSRTEDTSPDALAVIKDKNKRAFVDRNCLSFLLITGHV